MKKALRKSVEIWVPRVPKVIPKMIQKSTKIPSRTPLGHRWGPGVTVSGRWLHFCIIFVQKNRQLSTKLARNVATDLQKLARNRPQFALFGVWEPWKNAPPFFQTSPPYRALYGIGQCCLGPPIPGQTQQTSQEHVASAPRPPPWRDPATLCEPCGTRSWKTKASSNRRS